MGTTTKNSQPVVYCTLVSLTALMSSSWPLRVTVTPRALFPLPSTAFWEPRSAALAASALAISAYAWLSVLPLRSSRTCTRSTGCLSQAAMAGGVISYISEGHYQLLYTQDYLERGLPRARYRYAAQRALQIYRRHDVQCE